MQDPLNEEDPTPGLISLAPSPALADHPEFPLMLVCTLQRYRCTLAEVREDYWLGRAWRSLAGDPALKGRVARYGLCNILITGTDYGPAVPSGRERERWRDLVVERLAADTDHTLESLGLAVIFAERSVTIGEGCMLSLIAQTLAVEPKRWVDLHAFAHDLSPVVVPVAHAAVSFVAA